MCINCSKTIVKIATKILTNVHVFFLVIFKKIISSATLNDIEFQTWAFISSAWIIIVTVF